MNQVIRIDFRLPLDHGGWVEVRYIYDNQSSWEQRVPLPVFTAIASTGSGSVWHDPERGVIGRIEFGALPRGAGEPRFDDREKPSQPSWDPVAAPT